MTDPKKMVDKFDPLGIESLRVEEQEKLLQGYAITAGTAFTDPHEALNKSVSEQSMAAALRSAAESMQGQLRPSTIGLVGTDKSAIEKWAEMQKANDEQQERIAMALALNSYAARPAAHHNSILGLDPAISAHPLNTSEDQMRQGILGSSYQANTVAEQLRSEKMLSDDPLRSAYGLSSVTAENLSDFRLAEPAKTPNFFEGRTLIDNPAQDHFAHERKEMRKRENAKLEYARRSAEASEENLAAANQRAAVAEAGQARAERRETRMLWITVVAVIIGAIGAGASIWALLK